MQCCISRNSISVASRAPFGATSPEGSGTAYLMRQLFEDPDLQELDVRLSHHGLLEQAELVAQGKLDLAAFVTQEDAEFLRTIIRQYGLDIVSPQDLQGLIARYPWLSLGSFLLYFRTKQANYVLLI